MSFCSKCGTQLDTDAKFCPMCGAKCEAAIPEVTPMAPMPEMPAAEIPAAEIPAAEMPAAEMPAAEMPAAEIPAVEIPVAEMPAEEEPVAEMPAEEEPVAEEPAAEMPAAEEPVTVPVTEPEEEESKTIPIMPSQNPYNTQGPASNVTPVIPVAAAAATATVNNFNQANPYMQQSQPNPYMQQSQANPYMQQGRPNPYMQQSQTNPYMQQGQTNAYNPYMQQNMQYNGYNNQPVRPQVNPAYPPKLSETREMSGVYAAGGSIMTLLAAIFGTIYLGITIYANMNTYLASVSGLISGMLTVLPLMFVMIGLFVIFGTAKARSRSRAGYLLVKTGNIFYIVYSSILVVCSLICFFAILAIDSIDIPFLSDLVYDMVGYAEVAGMIACGIIFVVAILMLFFFIMMTRNMSLASKILSGKYTGKRKVSMFTIVCKYITLIFMFLFMVCVILAICALNPFLDVVSDIFYTYSFYFTMSDIVFVIFFGGNFLWLLFSTLALTVARGKLKAAKGM